MAHRRLSFLHKVALPVLLALPLSLLACQGGASTPNGAALYAKMCALCHGEQGEGYAAPGATALNNPDFLAVAGDEYLFENIARGRPGTRMSAWSKTHDGPLSDADVRALVAFIRQWQTEPSVDVSGVQVTGDAQRGATLYAQQCAICHGEEGQGLDTSPAAPQGAPSLNNPVFLETASDGFIRYAIAKGRRGTVMPAFEDTLTEQQIDDLAAFIRSLGSRR